ncbi:MAG: 1-deoxy-D-xylulose-5-phosphate reductoisomerase, partial [Streptosporangiaceae bacterium]
MDSASARRDVVVLGSTGSIGTQAADIIRRNPDRFRVAGLAAGGGNPDLLASQALEFGAEVVAVASDARVEE